jgi:hypothetical protein
VTSTNPGCPGGVFTLPGPFALDVNFNEAFSAGSLQASDLVLSGIAGATVTGVTALNGNTTARFTIGGITTEGKLNASIAAGALTDTFGNPSTAFAAAYGRRCQRAPRASHSDGGSPGGAARGCAPGVRHSCRKPRPSSARDSNWRSASEAHLVRAEGMPGPRRRTSSLVGSSSSRREATGLPMSQVTRILSTIARGAAHAADPLLPLVHQEFRSLAAQRLRPPRLWVSRRRRPIDIWPAPAPGCTANWCNTRSDLVGFSPGLRKPARPHRIDE